MESERVVVTGMTPICSLGIGNEQVWSNLEASNFKISSIKDYVFGEYSRDFPIYKIPHFDIKDFNINKEMLNEMKSWKDGEEVEDLYYILAAIDLAIKDSQLIVEKHNNIGLVLAHENPGLEQFCSYFFEQTYDLYKNNKELTKEEYFNFLNFKVGSNVNDLQTFMLIFYVARIFNLHGYSILLNNACASGLFAIESAVKMIRTKQCESVIVASSEHPSIYKYLWFEKLGLLSPSGLIKPFDFNRDGFICGQGASALVLESMESATKRNAKIYAEYLGGGYALESWKRTLPAVDFDYREQVIKEALKNSSLEASSIDLINVHGIGSKTIDAFEAISIMKVFGEKESQPVISAYKAYVGHTLGNCALLELILSVLSLHKGVFVPVVAEMNKYNFDNKCCLNLHKKNIINKNLKFLLKTVWGFAGYNAAIVFKKV